MSGDDPEIVGGYHRSAEMRPVSARYGQVFRIMACAGFGITHEPILRREAIRPAKHWVAPKDWTQREKRRPRR